MKKTNITDPNSQEGIDFCTQQCPYKECVVMEGNTLTWIKLTKEKSKARRLQKMGENKQEIAIILGKGIRTVERYLK